MDEAEKSVVRNLSLAPQGRLKMDWAWDHMPVLDGSVNNWFRSSR